MATQDEMTRLYVLALVVNTIPLIMLTPHEKVMRGRSPQFCQLDFPEDQVREKENIEPHHLDFLQYETECLKETHDKFKS